MVRRSRTRRIRAVRRRSRGRSALLFMRVGNQRLRFLSLRSPRFASFLSPRRPPQLERARKGGRSAASSTCSSSFLIGRSLFLVLLPRRSSDASNSSPVVWVSCVLRSILGWILWLPGGFVGRFLLLFTVSRGFDLCFLVISVC